jgi:hypothetical protein
MLAASGQVTYIHEPLNVERPSGLLPCETPHRLTYIGEHNADVFEPAFRHLLQLKYRFPFDSAALGSPREVARIARYWARLAVGSVTRRRPLIKDPFALFSAPWLAETFGCAVVVTVRHPAAVVSSRLRMGWRFPFDAFLQQPELMADWLHPVRDTIDRAVSSDDPVLNAAALWRVVYHVVDVYSARYPHFIIIRHEDLSAAPEQGYAGLYRALELDLTPRARARIERSAKGPRTGIRRSPYSVELDSRRNIRRWKQELTSRDVDRIRSITEDVAGRWYDDQAWE